MGIRKIIVVAATLLMAGTATAADSTSVQEVDVPWQKPWARTSDTATYADNAGQLGGKVESQLNVATAGLASYVPSTGVTGLPTCVAGYVLQKTATGFLCVNTISNANAANSANYSSTAGNGVAGVSGSTLNLTNGTQHTLPSGGGGGGASTCKADWPGPNMIQPVGWRGSVMMNAWGYYQTCTCLSGGSWGNCVVPGWSD